MVKKQTLGELLEKMKELDKETHEWGKDTPKPGKTYDVDYINSKRAITKREAADVYIGLLEHEELILYKEPLEERPRECIWVDEGKRYTCVSEHFVTGYSVLLGSNHPGIEEEREKVLTFGEEQLPHCYNKLFEEFHTSKENKKRAKWFGMKSISPFAGGSC